MKSIKGDVSIVNITELRNIEQSILSTMLLSLEKYNFIKKELDEKDFTFEVHNKIFKILCKTEGRFRDISNNGIFDIKLLDELLFTITDLLDNYGNLEQEYSLKILTSNPSLNIKEDINLIKFNSSEQDIAVNNQKDEDAVFQFYFEDSKNFTSAKFIQNKLISIYSEDVFNLPFELSDTVAETMENISKIDLQDNEIEAIFSPAEKEPEGIAIFDIKKDLSFIKKKEEGFNKLFEWADKYNISSETFPRNREKLEGLKILDVSHKNIKELPKEFYLLKSLKMLDVSFNKINEIPNEIMDLKKLIFICFKSNNIKQIPKGIEKLNKINHLCFCNNEISEIPENFFNLNSLNSFCIHGNNLKHLPEKISLIKNLETLSISNNYISCIPESISIMNNLKSFQFENNNIKEIKPEVLSLPNLNELAFDDNLLDTVSKHKHLLKNMETINLLESQVDSESRLIQSFSLNLEWEEWMDIEDKRENGCIKIATIKDESSEN